MVVQVMVPGGGVSLPGSEDRVFIFNAVSRIDLGIVSS